MLWPLFESCRVPSDKIGCCGITKHRRVMSKREIQGCVRNCAQIKISHFYGRDRLKNELF